MPGDLALPGLALVFVVLLVLLAGGADILRMRHNPEHLFRALIVMAVLIVAMAVGTLILEGLGEMPSRAVVEPAQAR